MKPRTLMIGHLILVPGRKPRWLEVRCVRQPSLTFNKLVTSVGRVESSYRDHLQRKDSRALLILSYWFSMMYSVNQCWVQNHVRSDCAAVCRFPERNLDWHFQ